MSQSLADVSANGITRRRLLTTIGLSTIGLAMVACGGTSAPAAAPAAPAPAAAIAAPTATTAAAPVVAAATATSAPAAAAVAASTTVNMTDDFKFDPAAITIAKGATVTWKGPGTQPHTVTFDPAKAMNKSHIVLPSGVAPFDSGILNPGQSYSHIFTVAGDYSYICIPHEAMGMIGTIKVS